jgi:hypothetical protein
MGGSGLVEVLVWPVGHVMDVEYGVVSVLLPELTRIKKHSVCWCTHLITIPQSPCVGLGCL